MNFTRPENTQLLSKQNPFAKVRGLDLELLEQHCTEILFEEGSIIVWPGDICDSVFIVKSGCLLLEGFDETGPLNTGRYLGPGESVFWEKLLKPEISMGTLRGQTTGRVLLLKNQDLKKLLIERPSLKTSLDPRKKGHSKVFSSNDFLALRSGLTVSRSGWKKLLPEKSQILFFSRRSILLTLLKSLPFLTIFLTSILLGVLLSWGLEPSQGQVSWILPSLGIFIGFIGCIFKTIDWLNDYIVLTKGFLLVKEMDLLSWKSQITRLPLSQVQALQISREGFWNYIFSLSQVSIKSSAYSQGIRFDGLPRSGILQEQLNHQLELMKTQVNAARQESLRQAVERHFGVSKPIKVLKSPQVQKSKKKSSLSWREEENGFIRYRRHPFLLWIKILPWVLAAITLLTAMVLIPFWAQDLIIIGEIVLFLIESSVFFMIWYLVEDWTNDSFLVTGALVIAYHRKPLWFGEEKKEIEINKIQEMTVEKKGIFSLFLGFGNLKIQTSGNAGPLLFDYVPHPEWIQGEISQAKSDWEKKTAEEKEKKQYNDLAAFVDVYQKAKDNGMLK